MKYVVLVPDGCADEPVDELDGKTPLEAASLPNLQALARRSEVGRATVIPGGLPPGSDVGNLSILGYDPLEFHTGRAPIEAAAMGVDLAADEVAYRCNLVTLGSDGTMVDFAAGHLSSEQSHPIVAALEAELGGGRDGVRFHAGVEYRHLVVTPSDWADAECTPTARPHGEGGDVPDRSGGGQAHRAHGRLASGGRRGRRRGRLDRDADLALGSGRPSDAPAVRRTLRRRGSADVERWISCAASACSPTSRCSTCRARAPASRTTTSRSATRVLRSLEDRDFFLLHVEATDEAGHQQNAREKVAALESWDREIIGPLLEALPDLGPHRVLLLPDHATPIRLGTHTSDPVPYLLYDSEVDVDGRPYTETATAGMPAVAAHELMGRLTRSETPISPLSSGLRRAPMNIREGVVR